MFFFGLLFCKANAVALMTVNSNNVDTEWYKMFEIVHLVLLQQKFGHLKEVYYSSRSEECVLKDEPPRVNLHHIETVSVLFTLIV